MSAYSATEVVVSVGPCDNGAQITAYTVTTSAGGGTAGCSTTNGATSCVVGWPHSRHPYKFQVTATNSVSTSNPSPPSTSVTPTAYVTAPAGPTAPSPAVPVDEPWQANEEIILRNTSASAMRLDGHALWDKDARVSGTTSFDSPDYIFPPGTTIPVGGTLRVLTGRAPLSPAVGSSQATATTSTTPATASSWLA